MDITIFKRLFFQIRRLRAPRDEVFELSKILNKFSNPLDDYARFRAIEDLGLWLHAKRPSKADHHRRSKQSNRLAELDSRIDVLRSVLETRPEAKLAVQQKILHAAASASSFALLTSTGLPREFGFWSDAAERSLFRVLPRTIDTQNLAELLGALFPDFDDADWIQSWSPEAQRQMVELIIGAPTQQSRKLFGIYRDSLAALKSLAAAIVSCAVNEDIEKRLRRSRLSGRGQNSVSGILPMLELLDSCVAVVEFAENDRFVNLQRLRGLCATAVSQLDASREQINRVMDELASTGVSLSIVYRLERMLALFERIEFILSAFSSLDRNRAIRDLLAHLTRGLHRDRSFVFLLRRNLHLISRNLVERIGESGEHYIARTRTEWSSVLRGAAGGGILACFAGAIKLVIVGLTIPLFPKGLLLAFNYAACFITMQAFGFKLATKQPAFFAGAVAAKMESTIVEGRSQDILSEIKFVSQSQFAATIGNIFLVIPASLILEFFWLVATGRSFLDLSEARYVVQSLDPFSTATIWYAMLTGGILFVASLMGSWLENMLVFRDVVGGIEHSRKLRWVLGKQRAQKIAAALLPWSAGIGTSIALALMLGLVPVFGKFIGLPLDVRHVTLSTAQLTLGLGSQGLFAMDVGDSIRAFLGITISGILNFGVSFILGFLLAARARNLPEQETLAVMRAVYQEFMRSPIRFMVPEKAAHSKN